MRRSIDGMKHFDVIGVPVTAIDRVDAAERVIANLRARIGGYICFTNVHTAVVARRHRDYARTIDGAYMALADGRPIYWIGRVKRVQGVGHVPGPDFMWQMLANPPKKGLRHYLYGGRPEVLERLVSRIQQELPSVALVGWESPPFRNLTDEEKQSVVQRIEASGADIVWVGLGAPKQEFWMSEHAELLRPSLLMGVGAAFDFHAGMLKRAPSWMRSLGLEWLHRLIMEPKRLWRRYLVTNVLFAWYLLGTGTRRKRR